MRQVAHGGAAVALIDRNTQQSKIAHPLPQVVRKIIIPVDSIGNGSELSLNKLACCFTQHGELLTQPMI